jgi:hypothetical protein
MGKDEKAHPGLYRTGTLLLYGKSGSGYHIIQKLIPLPGQCFRKERTAPKFQKTVDIIRQ